jgi:hypothetical protein
VLYSASQVGEAEKEEEEESEDLDDTLSELGAVSLGLPESQVQKSSGTIGIVILYEGITFYYRVKNEKEIIVKHCQLCLYQNLKFLSKTKTHNTFH